jgi:hypothetical protein
MSARQKIPINFFLIDGLDVFFILLQVMVFLSKVPLCSSVSFTLPEVEIKSCCQARYLQFKY